MERVKFSTLAIRDTLLSAQDLVRKGLDEAALMALTHAKAELNNVIREVEKNVGKR